jgi:dTDP-4-amino-4,6-dideoxygalactose transaminase
MKRINVTESFLPPLQEYENYIHEIFTAVQLTNQGPMVKKLNERLRNYLGVENFQFLSNGTIALQLALEAFDLHDCEVITTPFTYVATTSTILWQRCTPVYVDIDPNSLCIDPNLIERSITEKTKAIMPVHVFGFPCDVEAIDRIAQKHNLKVIYDAAHAFGVKIQGRSLLDFGDVSTCSFHATKLFHTIEGGAVIAKDKETDERMQLSMRFGHNGDDHIRLGINAKNSEFHAAMGLVNLNYVDELILSRKAVTEIYDDALMDYVVIPKPTFECTRNYGYYPIILKDEAELLRLQAALNEENIFPRRYFYPSLNLLPYVEKTSCPVSESIASRILCLPLYAALEQGDQERIIKILVRELRKN